MHKDVEEIGIFSLHRPESLYSFHSKSVAVDINYFKAKKWDMETAFYMLAAGTGGSCVALLTGMVDHRKKFKGAWVPILKKKLGAVLGGLAACATFTPSCSRSLHG